MQAVPYCWILRPTSYRTKKRRALWYAMSGIQGWCWAPTWHPCTILFSKYNINEPPLRQRYEFIIAFIGQDLGRRSDVQRSSVTLAAKAENGGWVSNIIVFHYKENDFASVRVGCEHTDSTHEGLLCLGRCVNHRHGAHSSVNHVLGEIPPVEATLCNLPQ